MDCEIFESSRSKVLHIMIVFGIARVGLIGLAEAEAAVVQWKRRWRRRSSRSSSSSLNTTHRLEYNY